MHSIDTYQAFYKNEVREAKISIRYQDYTIATPTSASTFQVTDYNEEEVILSERLATVSSNTLSALIDTTVTSVVGNYCIKWKIVFDNDYIYYHKTQLEVADILNNI
jgi:hypothetical protein